MQNAGWPWRLKPIASRNISAAYLAVVGPLDAVVFTTGAASRSGLRGNWSWKGWNVSAYCQTAKETVTSFGAERSAH